MAPLDELSQLPQRGGPDAATEFLRVLSGLLGLSGSDQVANPRPRLPTAAAWAITPAASGRGPFFFRALSDGGKIFACRESWIRGCRPRGAGAPPSQCPLHAVRCSCATVLNRVCWSPRSAWRKWLGCAQRARSLSSRWRCLSEQRRSATPSLSAAGEHSAMIVRLGASMQLRCAAPTRCVRGVSA